MNLISSKIAKHVDVLKLFASIALRTVSLQQLLHYDVTTRCCETLAHTLDVSSFCKNDSDSSLESMIATRVE